MAVWARIAGTSASLGGLTYSWVWGHGWLMMTLFGWRGPRSVLYLFPSSRSIQACLHASQFPRAKPEHQALWSYNRVSVCILHGIIPSTKARHMGHPRVSGKGSKNLDPGQLSHSGSTNPTISSDIYAEPGEPKRATGQRGKKAQNSVKAGEARGDDTSFSFALFPLSPVFSPDPHGSTGFPTGRR